MRLSLGLPLIVYALIFVFTVLAQDSTETQELPTLGGTVRGEIVNVPYEFPIDGVRVVLQSEDGKEYTTTTNYGDYTFTGIPAGRYLISISKKGYHDRFGKPITVVNGGDHYLPLKMAAMESLMTAFRRLLIYIFLLCGITALFTFLLTKRWLAKKFRN